MSEVIWKDVEGYDGKYQISSTGEVKSFSRWSKGKILKGGYSGNPGPYRYIVLVKTCRKDAKMFYIHRLVAQHFIENPHNKAEVNHIDGNTLNNDISNLEWCTRKENAKHASATGLLSKEGSHKRGKAHPMSKPVIQRTADGAFVKEWESVNQIMRETGIKADRIFRCCSPKYPHDKSAAGYKWEYKYGENQTNNKG